MTPIWVIGLFALYFFSNTLRREAQYAATFSAVALEEGVCDCFRITGPLKKKLALRSGEVPLISAVDGGRHGCVPEKIYRASKRHLPLCCQTEVMTGSVGQ